MDDDLDAGIRSACTAILLDLFPDICPSHLEKTAEKFQYDTDRVIEEILGSKSYPKISRVKSLKRKREASQDGDEMSKLRRKYDHADRPEETAALYIKVSKKVLAQDFPRATSKNIAVLFQENKNLLFRTYLALDEINRGWQDGKVVKPGFEMKKTRTAPDMDLTPAKLGQTIENSTIPDRTRALEELRDVRQLCYAETAKRIAVYDKERAEARNLREAEEEGTTQECGCCWGTFALNRMVSCSKSDQEHASFHWFCVECARRSAEHAIGLTKFELKCMSMDGCSAGFSHSQRAIFLDDKLIAALDRIECEAVLIAAGFENLETCPFCPYAAEYPSVAINKEFSCANKDCQVVSCRLCREETHIPQTCEEAARANGLSARREIEEAMSAALIRKCNKCATPFIKEEGCNKMTCTRPGCRNVQCYICSKSCDYTHFNDRTRGGKEGNCPLFEPIQERHDKEVQEAETRTRQKVMENNPDLDEDLLKFNLSEEASKTQKEEKDKLKRRQKEQIRARAQQRAALYQERIHNAQPRPPMLQARPPPPPPVRPPPPPPALHPNLFGGVLGAEDLYFPPQDHRVGSVPSLHATFAPQMFADAGWFPNILQQAQGQENHGDANLMGPWHSPSMYPFNLSADPNWQVGRPMAGPSHQGQHVVASASGPAVDLQNFIPQAQKNMDRPILGLDGSNGGFATAQKNRNQAPQPVQRKTQGASSSHPKRPAQQPTGEAHRQDSMPPMSAVMGLQGRRVHANGEIFKSGRSMDDPLELD
ncbi:ring finger domain-containing protein [Colletotrichum karsti]|uniref:Ring finger domain-containing protein n=1 Tax=Colletotrichum karsti TaxID=1095194 RepID=A0A9P6LJA9_9PEZI|nr:ring finger domain-containing protein [Colletotrichum karsti]KAF9874635.1 ring finger domain-containing protein [Colletotrichum karsti]